MKEIVLFGAGKSASSLIKYLSVLCSEKHWHLTVCDQNLEALKKKVSESEFVSVKEVNVEDQEHRASTIIPADIVISMVPAFLHFIIAEECLTQGKNLLTASYIDEASKSLAERIKAKGLLFLYEMGLDPGIDHMSAMRIIDEIKLKGGEIRSFKSHCGGLVAPESDDNPWHYKVSWNTRNIVLAGKDGAVYKENGKNVEIPYSGSHGIFRNNQIVNIESLPDLGWYANRNSLSYIDIYNLPEASTFIRTTLRYPSFNRGWGKLVNMGLTSTDDFNLIKDCKSYFEWFTVKMKPYSENETSWNSYLHLYVTDPNKGEFDKQIAFLGLQSKEVIPISFTCSADIMQDILEKKLSLKPEDRDMVVMLHEFEYSLNNVVNKLSSSLIVKGDNAVDTAMAKTVGLPLGIATKLILEGAVNETGLHIPIIKEIYGPVLEELEVNGIRFVEIED